MEVEKMVGAKLENEKREELALVLTARGVTFRKWLETMIEQEMQKIEMENAGYLPIH